MTKRTADRWRVLGALSEGGMGLLFRARTPEGQDVVVKVVAPDRSEESSALREEIRFLSRLRHPNLVAFLGFAENSEALFGENRGPCYWMEDVGGAEVLPASRGQGPDVLLNWFRTCLEALIYLHSQKILHGDLSPRNIVIDRDGSPRLLDFGTAGFLGEVSFLPSAATFPYAAPERLSGVHRPAGDLFSLGTVFYEAFSGVHPRGACRDLRELLSFEPKPLLAAAPHLSPAWEIPSRVIDRMIALDLARRFSDVSEVFEALDGKKGKAASLKGFEYRTARMIESEAPFEAFEEVLSQSRPSALFCVHGIAGVGKSRFLKEASIECALRGVSSRILPSLKEALRLVLEKDRPEGILFVEGNDEDADEHLRKILNFVRKSAGVRDTLLKNLSREGTRRFLSPLGSDFEKLSEDLFELTGGNPRLLVESVTLLGEAAAAPERRKALASLKRNPSLQAMTALRLRSLAPSEESVLILAAAAHEPVTADALKRVFESRAVASALTSLSERGLISPAKNSEGTTLYGLAFSFLEPLVLDRLRPNERAERHRLWLEALKGTAYPHPQKLHHALCLREEAEVRAGARPTAEFLWEKGDRTKALDLVNRSLEVVKDRDETSRLFRLQMNLLNELGRFEEALTVADTWLQLNAKDEPAGLRDVKYWFIKGSNHRALGRIEESSRSLKTCLEKGGDRGNSKRPFLAKAWNLLGVNALDGGNVPEALENFQKALDLVEKEGRERAEICRNLAAACGREGKWEEAGRWLNEAKALYRKSGFLEGLFNTLLQEGLLALARKDLDGAETAFHEAESTARERKSDLFLAMAWTNLGLVARKRGDLAAALERLIRAGEILDALGNPDDQAENLKQQALCEAEAGRFDRAEEAARRLPPAFSEEIFRRISELRDGDLEADPLGPDRLREIYEALPAAFQITFVDRADYRKFFTQKNVPAAPKAGASMEDDMTAILETLSKINRDLLTEEDMGRVFDRLMDAAMELSQAESGFLVVSKEGAMGPIPGFDVVVRRNIGEREMETDEYAFSLSAVKRALNDARPVVTDNALQDVRFRDAKSVHVRKLKSIAALPIRGVQGPIGVFYLDHRFEPGLFEGNVLASLNAFADLAGLALQKAGMIASLRETNVALEGRVEDQASQVDLLQRDLKESRVVLKNQYEDIIGRSPAMAEVLSLVDRITASKVPVWIFGESGTGKEAVARSLHFNSPRAAHPFVTENCGALPESLLESELFGHKKGAFTHAVADKKGILQYADGGTIFLDEIADMSLALQAKLLRFLQEGEFRPLGGHHVVKVDVRVVSASNKDLQELVSQGKFREDLFFRLNGVTVTLPPLRERLEDLPLLAKHFLKAIAAREKTKPCQLHPETLALLMKYSWPGNIRELQNLLETAVLFADKGIISTKSLRFKPAVFGGKASSPKGAPSMASEIPTLDPDVACVLAALRDSGYHKGNAAKALGISRRYLYFKLERYGIPPQSGPLKAYIEKHLN